MGAVSKRIYDAFTLKQRRWEDDSDKVCMCLCVTVFLTGSVWVSSFSNWGNPPEALICPHIKTGKPGSNFSSELGIRAVWWALNQWPAVGIPPFTSCGTSGSYLTSLSLSFPHF